jgi:hypothetical protein
VRSIQTRHAGRPGLSLGRGHRLPRPRFVQIVSTPGLHCKRASHDLKRSGGMASKGRTQLMGLSRLAPQHGR